MKKLACYMLATAFAAVAFAQVPATEKATVISSFRIFPKPAQAEELKAALGNHTKKFHSGDSAQRIYSVISGPDSGSYHVVTGPTTWTAIDERKGLGAEHDKDVAANITPHVERWTPTQFATFSKTLSTVAATKFSDKVMIRRYTLKPSMMSAAADYFKAMKPAWEKQGQTVAVWQSAFSGKATYSLAFRLKNGFKDFDAELPSLRKALEELSGPNEYARLQALGASAFEEVISELMVYRPELSSK